MNALRPASAPRRTPAGKLLCTLLLLPALLALVAARAATMPNGEAGQATASSAYRQECSACHLAYPPELLSARAWKQVIGGLARHFGTDASLEPAAAHAIEAWLVARADPSGADPADGRISHTDWFRHEHGELPGAVWKRPAIRSASNCAACHRGAEQGDFDEDRVRIPR